MRIKIVFLLLWFNVKIYDKINIDSIINVIKINWGNIYGY